MPIVPRCYFRRRTFVILDRSSVERMGYIWCDNLFPDCAVWRMHWYAARCNVHIDDIHAFQADGGKWRYCFANNVRQFSKYELTYGITI